jgi:hypothetical protein
MPSHCILFNAKKQLIFSSKYAIVKVAKDNFFIQFSSYVGSFQMVANQTTKSRG